ncbi:hypothetical protein ABB02_00513 [Clostridiaceae bacterium JG1575]|nr:hypothetical protein ABB02_00674 [Clostridiaceae bacterium JG1575]PKK40194.1 hypothetical protein ABB02_00513 [Clostridiaceae bacterium JG1575]
MVSKIRRFLTYHKTKLMVFLAALTLILGFIGSWQYYSERPINEGTKFSAAIYATIKLYLFFPTVGPGEHVPVAYELAKWMAPFVTAYALFTALGNFLRRAWIQVRHRAGTQYTVFGLNEQSEYLIRDLLKKDPRCCVTVVTLKNPEEADRLAMERQWVRIMVLDLIHPNEATLDWDFKRLNLTRSKAVVLFEEEADNFAILRTLQKHLPLDEGTPELSISVAYSSDVMRDLMARSEEALRRERPISALLNMNYFNIPSYMATALLHSANHPIYEANLRRLQGAPASLDRPTIEKRLGRVHLLICGFSKEGQEILIQAVPSGVLQTQQNMRVTILDPNAAELLDELKGRYEFLDEVAELHSFSVGPYSGAFKEVVAAACADEPFTYASFNSPDINENAQGVLKALDALANIPVAVRAAGQGNIVDVLNTFRAEGLSIFPYGDYSDLITREVIINEVLDLRAKNSHMNYLEESQLPNEGREKEWQKLPLFKKESNRAQVAHLPFKVDFLQTFFNLSGGQEIPELITAWEEEYRKVGEPGLLALLAQQPALDYLTRLEHKRWCDFHRMKNFSYAPTTDFAQKKHNCLIPDWQDFLCSPVADKAKYDTFTIFTLPKNLSLSTQ